MWASSFILTSKGSRFLRVLSIADAPVPCVFTNYDSWRRTTMADAFRRSKSEAECLPMSEMAIWPVILEGRYVRLEPLTADHTAGLAEIGLDEDLWRWIPTPVRTLQEMSAYVQTALGERANSSALPFVLIDKVSGRVIGSTRYGNIDRVHHRVEIGWTWVAQQWQRSAINTEAKYLLLRHAFETLRCIRVELKTDSLNERSRAAILRIGAREEGTFRNHMITASGRIRHTVYFSILDSEWPDVKTRLESKLR
jgi:N-acetyltransferase